MKKVTGTLTISFTVFVPDETAEDEDEICEIVSEDQETWEGCSLDVKEISALTAADCRTINLRD